MDSPLIKVLNVVFSAPIAVFVFCAGRGVYEGVTKAVRKRGGDDV